MTSAVLSNFIDWIATASSKRPAISSPIPSSDLYASVDKSAEHVVRYHAGWCLVAARRELEQSQQRDKIELCSLVPVFGKDITSSFPPCLENMSKISKLADQQSLQVPAPPDDHDYACQPPTSKHEQGRSQRASSTAIDDFSKAASYIVICSRAAVDVAHFLRPRAE